MSSVVRPIAIRWVKLLVLLGCGLLFTMLQLLNLYPGSSAALPNFLLVFVYYWAVHQPRSMPSWVVALLGLYYDLLVGVPLGLNALPLLMVWWGMGMQRRFVIREPFLVRWAMVSVVVMLYYVLISIAVSFCSGCGEANGLWLLQMLTTALVYPLMHAVCGFLFLHMSRF